MPIDGYAALDSLLTLVGRAAQQGPLVIIIDDLHLADEQTRRVEVSEKVMQSAVLLGLAGAVTIAAWRRAAATTDQPVAPGVAR